MLALQLFCSTIEISRDKFNEKGIEMNKQFEREEQQIEDDFNDGHMSQAQYNSDMRDMQQSYREEAQESAQDAYEEEMGRW